MRVRNLGSREAYARIRPHLVALMIAIALVVVLPRARAAGDVLNPIIQHDLQFAAQQLDRAARTIATNRYPSITGSSGAWNTTDAGGWTSGFFPGALWLVHQRTGESLWRTRAETWTAGLDGQKDDISTHDVGFKIFTSFGNGYRLTGNDTYRQVILTAAGSLAQRYDPDVGCTRSWGSISDTSNFTVIIDNMMNIELLFWASKHGGKPEWYDMAVSHALKTMANHVRADGSTYQIVNYNPTNGVVKSKATKQGYNTESTWSRGQAWAVYGFTMAYRETGDIRFLETARKTADYFITHLPGDEVPFWDFELPSTTGQPKDSSAAAIAASALLELSQRESDAQRSAAYLSAARNILTSLSSPAYLAEGTTNQAILLHGTQNKPDGKYDSGLIYGDYYFIEALLRYLASSPTSATPSPTTVSTTPTGTPAIAPTATPQSTPTATPPTPSGSPIKSLTFEAGSLTGTSGADSVSGAISLETSAPIKGSFAARIPNSSSGYLRETFTAADTLYVSLYLKIHERPPADTRILLISNSGMTVGALVLGSSGALRLRNAGNPVGIESTPLAVGTIYRVGLRQQRGTGANAILEASLAAGDAAFGAPFAATAGGTWISAATELRVGATNGNLTHITVDDIKLDSAAMPAPSSP